MARIEETGARFPSNPEVRYEHSDINSRHVVWTGIWILLGAWISALLLYFFFQFLTHYREEAGAPPLPRAQGRTQVPPEPRLQSSPRADLEEMRASEDAQLHSFRWIDKQNGVVGIPIEQAIQMTVQRGIPAQKAPANSMYYPPQAGTRETGFEGKVEPEPR
ncbi:MAG: hypothetical protein JO307_33835 [Bryobacterales bacterium]|nr:hypothetical protein [Bryobacterales bacterium]MBV9401060.1 hypothetical protein [Bryobacterales bacterium]